ncbi:MAG: hypothetical protein AAF519_02320, partial [Bacteroidota bacterium]
MGIKSLINRKTLSLLLILFLSIAFNELNAQCSISGLNSDYCLNDAIDNFTAGSADRVIGNGTAGSGPFTFDPSVAGVGTHTVVVGDGASDYNVSTAGTFNRIAPPAFAVLLPINSNSESSAIPIFNFDFFGATYSNIIVSSQVYLRLATIPLAPPTPSDNESIPNVAGVDNIIAPAWDFFDINNGGTIRYWTEGVAPFRVFYVDFENIYRTSSYNVTTQVKLFETTNSIEIHTASALFASNGNAATQGIENATGTVGYTLAGRNNQSWDATNDFVAFIPTCLDQIVVNVDDAPTADAGGDVTLCDGETVILGGSPSASGGSGGYLYSWSPSTGLSATNSSNPVFTSSGPQATTTYTLTVTDGNGCMANSTLDLTVTGLPAAPSVTDQVQTVCEGDVVNAPVASGSGGIFTWYSDVGLTTTIFTGASPTLGDLGFSSASAGVTTVYVTETLSSCEGPSSAITLTVNANPTADAGSNVIVCDGESTILGGTPSATGGNGSYSYSWSPATNLSASNISNPIFTSSGPQATTTYTLTVTDGNGCMASSTLDLTVTGLPAAPSVTNQVQMVCEGDVVNAPVASGSGGTFTWYSDVGLTTTIFTGASPSLGDIGFSSASAGVTTVYVTETLSGCEGLAAVVSLTINSLPSPTISGANDVCDGDSGIVYMTEGGQSNYVWTVSSGGTVTSGGGTSDNTITITWSGAGARTVEVNYTNTSGCDASAATIYNVTVNALPTITSQPMSQSVCEGNSTSFSVVATGTSLNYQWQVDNGGGFTNVTNGGFYSGATTSTLSISDATFLSGFDFRVAVTELGGSVPCELISSGATLTLDPIPLISNQPADIFVCSDETASFSVSAMGTTLSYQWRRNGADIDGTTDGGVYSGFTSANLSINNVNGLNGNSYDVVVTESSGFQSCPITSSSGTLSVSPIPIISTQPTDQSACSGDA